MREKLLFSTTYEGESIQVWGTNYPSLGGKSIKIVMGNNPDFLPEWQFDADETKKLLLEIQKWLS